MYHDTYGTVSLSNKLGDYNLDLIHLVNLFIVQHWIIQSLSSCFSFGHSLIDRLMLEKSGVQFEESGTMKGFNMCSDCSSLLMNCKVPQLALANHLF